MLPDQDDLALVWSGLVQETAFSGYGSLLQSFLLSPVCDDQQLGKLLAPQNHFGECPVLLF